MWRCIDELHGCIRLSEALGVTDVIRGPSDDAGATERRIAQALADQMLLRAGSVGSVTDASIEATRCLSSTVRINQAWRTFAASFARRLVASYR